MARITELDLIALVAKYKKPVSANRMAKALKIPDPNLAVRFRTAFAHGYLKHATAPKDATKVEVFYELSAKGKKYLDGNKDGVQSIEQILLNYKNDPVKKMAGKSPVVVMSKKANDTVNSISQLIDEHNHAIQTLKQIYALAGNLLTMHAKETDNEQSDT